MTSHDGSASVSRRGAMRAAMSLLALAGTFWVATKTALAQNLIAQQAAQYRDHPNGEHKCAGCSHFKPPQSCGVVEGTISPNGWCLMFSPKE